ncbi:hypothetical protein JMJ56_11830 [Belnapia sp. T18]|uniref:Uncharacterized protein n=1 Tax=Belnapia arida TaxID=2804533 RepID=A0ABS1U429_9PROT|nr:hypothetical protein [Belnapia arida]MBL6078699.1 hypothetical protein [Belnapia arida]
MNGKDMHRIVGRWTAGKPIRDSLAELHRQQQATPPATAVELHRRRRAEAAGLGPQASQPGRTVLR